MESAVHDCSKIPLTQLSISLSNKKNTKKTHKRVVAFHISTCMHTHVDQENYK